MMTINDYLKMSEERLSATQFLKSTGVLDAYEYVIESLVANGVPEDTTLYDHAAH